MPVPKRKVSRARRDKRRTHKVAEEKPFNMCTSGVCASEPIMPNTVCLRCGYYKGRKIMKTKHDKTEQKAAPESGDSNQQNVSAEAAE
jgi:large subunit ribosomal protein L32